MFLPILLMRDYGWPAWFIFAIPNVVGAAAMGWTLRSPDHARAMVRAHLPAMLAFSAVTRAFQWFFAFALINRAISDGTQWGIIGAASIAIVISGLELRKVSVGRTPWSGLLFWLTSVGLLTAGLIAAGDVRPTSAVGRPVDLLGLLFVCGFGFALCPYLDLTFHRARIESPAPRFSFGFGFGFMFLLMIVGTALYSTQSWHTRSLGTLLIAFHIISQIGFTVEAHAAEIRANAGGITPQTEADDEPLRNRLVKVLPVASMAAGLLAFLAAMYGTGIIPDASTPAEGFEWVYRVFMGFYGLVFPTYALIAMVPTWSSPQAPTAVMLRAWIVGSLVAMPASYLAFIRKEMLWAFPAMVVVLAAAAFARHSSRRGPERPITLSRDRDPGS